MSGEEKSELMRLVAEEVQRMMVEETEKKRKKQQKTQKERKKQREGEAAKRKAEAVEKKKAEEHRCKSIDGKKRNREERANEAQNTQWLSHGALSTTSTPSPSGFLSEPPLSLPKKFPPK